MQSQCNNYKIFVHYYIIFAQNSFQKCQKMLFKEIQPHFPKKSDMIEYFCLQIWIRRIKNYGKLLFFSRQQEKKLNFADQCDLIQQRIYRIILINFNIPHLE